MREKQSLFMVQADRRSIMILGIFALIAKVWSVSVGMSWSPSDAVLWIVPAAFWVLFVAYRVWRPSQRGPAEIFYYSALWLLFPMFGTQITYLAVTLGHPMQDALFAAADRRIGFDWPALADFLAAHPVFYRTTEYLYDSYYVLPYVVMITLAMANVPERNANFFKASAIGLAITIVLSAILPAIGPAPASGFFPPSVQTLADLHAGRWTEMSYTGIICFPSYHTIMAVLAVCAMRGMDQLFRITLLWSAAIVSSVPFWGNHYLIDVIAGVVTAFIAQSLAGWAWQASCSRTSAPRRATGE